jgi:hypothetical protein
MQGCTDNEKIAAIPAHVVGAAAIIPLRRLLPIVISLHGTRVDQANRGGQNGLARRQPPPYHGCHNEK